MHASRNYLSHLRYICSDYGALDPVAVVENIQRGDYDLVVLEGGRTVLSYRGVSLFGPRIVAAINQEYEVFCTAGNTLVLTPRRREIGATPEILGPIVGQRVSNAGERAPRLSLGATAR
jgi:hypothetical protein